MQTKVARVILVRTSNCWADEHMLDWESVKAEFVWEGSWRDICVPGVSIDEWRAMASAIPSAGFANEFQVGGTVTSFPEDVAAAFARSPDSSSSLWSVFADRVRLCCHFFDQSEIEFDLDPREVAGQSQLDAVLEFMRVLAAATGRVALLTPENMHDAPFIRVPPTGAAEYSSSEGFFEELSRGRS
jgi:hypothetical protein